MRSFITDFVFALGGSATLAILFKATVVLMLGLAVAAVAAHARASWRHLIFATTFALLIALPMVVASGPAFAIEVPVAESAAGAAFETSSSTTGTASAAVQAPEASSSAPAASGSSFAMPSLSSVLLTLWFGGAFLLIVSMAIDLMKVRNLRRHGLPSQPLTDLTRTLAREGGVRRRVDVLLHENVPAPFTCGWLRPAVILPPEATNWSSTELRHAIVHELEHIRRGDWPSQLAARAACAFYWFHPMVWMAWRKLCLEAERACDDAVLEKAESTQYAEQLVELSQQMSNVHSQPMLGMAKRSDLATRVSSLLDGSQARGRAGLAAAACSVIVGAFVLFSIGPIIVVAQSSSTPRIETKTAIPGADIKQAVRDDRGPGSRLNRDLLESASDGDIPEILRLLSQGADANAQVRGDGTPLIAAAREGHIDAVKLLLERGADVNLGIEGDGNPLIMAAREGHLQVVSLLLDRGADINMVVPSDENALIQAAGEGRLNVVKLLVERGADVNIEVNVQRGDGTALKTEVRSAVRMAAKGRHGDVVSYLLSKGAREQ